MKIYISGKISGLTPEEFEHNFAEAEKVIKAHGHEPINPIKILPFDEKYIWQDYMRADIKALMDCEAVYALKNHTDSKGAMIEVKLARDLGMKVYDKFGELPLVF